MKNLFGRGNGVGWDGHLALPQYFRSSDKIIRFTARAGANIGLRNGNIFQLSLPPHYPGSVAAQITLVNAETSISIVRT